MENDSSGQGAIEYLLLIAAVIIVVSIVIVAITSVTQSGQINAEEKISENLFQKLQCISDINSLGIGENSIYECCKQSYSDEINKCVRYTTHTWQFENYSNYVFHDSNCELENGNLKLKTYYVENSDTFFSEINFNKSNYVKNKNNKIFPNGELDWNSDAVIDNNAWKDNNLVAYYKFNEKNGTTIYDTANSNNGTLTNGADINAYGLWDTNAGSFDGVNDYINISDVTSNINSLQQGAFSIWFKKETSSTTEYIGSVSYNGNDNSFISMARIASDGELSGYVNTSLGTNNLINTGSYVDDDKWHNIVFQSNGSSYEIYLDGVNQSLSFSSGSNNGDWIGDFANTANSATIGNLRRTTNGVYFNGLIDEVKIYDDALTQEEIIEDYNSFLEAKIVDNNIQNAYDSTNWDSIKINTDTNFDFGSELKERETYFYDSNLIGLWHLNDNANDSSGNEKSGAWSGTEAYSNGLWNTNAGDLDGVSDYITISDFSRTTTTKPNTLSAWVYPRGANNQNEIQGVVSIMEGALNPQNIMFTNADGNMIKCASYLSTDNAATSYYSIPLNKWSFVTCTYSVSGNMTTSIYINGELKERNEGSGDYQTSADSIKIGVFKTTFDRYFNGLIEEVAVWDKALSDEQVRNLYRKGIGKVDLNVFTCSDIECEEKTDSVYIEDVNNNYLMDISSLSNSQFLGWSAHVKPVDEFVNENAGRFYTMPFIENYFVDYNKNFTKENCVVDMNFQTSNFLQIKSLSKTQTLNDGNISLILTADGGTSYTENELPFTIDNNLLIQATIESDKNTPSPLISKITANYE